MTSGPGTRTLRVAGRSGWRGRFDSASRWSLVTYRVWSRLFTIGALAFLLLAALVFFAAAGGIWIGGGALNT